MTDAAIKPSYSAWNEPIAGADFRAFVMAAKARGRSPESNGLGGDPAKGGFFTGVWLIAGGLFGVLLWMALAGDPAYRLIGILCLIVVGFGAGGLGVICALLYAPRFLRRWRLFYRASIFARDNGLEYLVQAPVPGYDGMVFNIPSAKRGANYILRKPDSPVAEAGQLCYLHNVPNTNRPVTKTRKWGYIAIELPVSAPERVILRSNAAASEHSVELAFAQKISSGIMLNDVYTVFSAPKSDPIARQVFTPELLVRIQALEQKFSPVNAELRGNHLYIFSLNKPFYMYKSKHVRLVFDTIAATRPAKAANDVQ